MATENHTAHCNHDHHPHFSEKLTTAFNISIFLNIIFVAVEIFYGYAANSVSLMADAFHNLSDVFSLVIALVGFIFSKKNQGKKISAGISTFNSVLLIATILLLMYKSIGRLQVAESIDTHTVGIVAFVGIIINFGAAYLFKTHQHDDLNAAGAYLHLMADAAISFGVVVSAVVIQYTQFYMLDPLISIVISLIILFSTVKLLKKSIREYRACTS